MCHTFGSPGYTNNNYSVIYLINNKDSLELKSFIKVLFNKCIKANSSNFPIIRHSKEAIKKALNSIASPNINNLALLDIIVINGFYINIIFKA
jgi:hypothetical protein